MPPVQTINENSVREMIAEFLYCDPANIGPEADFKDDLGLDRLDLLTQIEARYQIAIDDSQLTEVANFGQLMLVVEQAQTQ